MNHDAVVNACANWFKSDTHVTLIAKGYGRTFPNPDVRVQYQNNRIAFVECKPSDAGGREYLTGLGQSLAYLTFADFSYLALPQKEMNEYEQYFWIETVGLLSIRDDMTVQIHREASQSEVLVTREEPRVRGYGYYRDLRPLEIYAVLKAIERQRARRRRANIQQIKDAMWQQVCRMRNIRSQRQKNSWILNMSLLLRDLQVINPNDYSLTEDGFRLLQLGELQDKQPFLNQLAKLFLINANYLDIVTIIQSLNDKYSGFTSVSQFKNLLIEEITNQKLATEGTNVMRDLQDIPRILRDLNVLTSWRRIGLAHRYVINWKYVLSVIA
jgi:hypothetical protein